MNKKQSQSGFAHLVIIIVLVVLLLGTLGFVFYQNFMQSKTVEVKNDTATNTSKTTTDSTTLLSKSITETVTGDNLTLDYPSNWILTSQASLNPDQETSNEHIYITSPDNNIKIILWAGISGIGGACDPESAGTFSSVKTYSLTNYSGYTLYETIVSGDSTSASALVRENNDAIQVGSSACVNYIGSFSSKNGSSNQLGINIENALSEHTLTNINNARETDNYKTAVKIVQSLHEQ